MKMSEVLWGEEAWCRGALAREGRVCLIGALATVLGHDPVLLQEYWMSKTPVRTETMGNVFGTPEWRRLRSAVEARLPGTYMSVGRFNDTSDWSEIAEVVARYDELTRMEEMEL